MSKHPYPDHVVEAVAEAMGRSRTGEDWGRFQDYFIEHTHVALQALWDASRVETYEALSQVPDGTVIFDNDGYIGMKRSPGQWMEMLEVDNEGIFEGSFFIPAHVIYWGDTDE